MLRSVQTSRPQQQKQRSGIPLDLAEWESNKEDGNGYKRYNGVRRKKAPGSARDFMRGDVIYLSGNLDNEPCIVQIVDFYEKQLPKGPKTLSVRWLYHLDQMEQQEVLKEWEQKGNTLYSDELFLWDHVEHEPKPLGTYNRDSPRHSAQFRDSKA